MLAKFVNIFIPLYGMFRIRGVRNRKDLDIKKKRLVHFINRKYGAISYAIKTNNDSNLETLCKYYANNNIEYRYGMTAFEYAIKTQNYIAVQKLIKHGQNINETDSNGYAPIHYSIRYSCTWNDANIVEILLDNGASINQIDKNGYTPFYIALNIGNIHIIQLLINKGIRVNIEIKNINITPLEFASSYSSVEIVKLLLNNGANIRNSNFNGLSAIGFAKKRTDKMKTKIIEILERWSFTMIITVLQELRVYSYLDVSTIIDINDFVS
jgi:ankyrin repeat protein